MGSSHSHHTLDSGPPHQTPRLCRTSIARANRLDGILYMCLVFVMSVCVCALHISLARS